MIGKEIKTQRAITLTEAMKIMEERKKDGELGFEQQTTYDHLKARNLLGDKETEEMLKELSKIEKLTQEIAIKVVDLLPRTESELSIIVAKERHAFSKAEMEQILKIVEKYAKE